MATCVSHLGYKVWVGPAKHQRGQVAKNKAAALFFISANGKESTPHGLFRHCSKSKWPTHGFQGRSIAGHLSSMSRLANHVVFHQSAQLHQARTFILMEKINNTWPQTHKGPLEAKRMERAAHGQAGANGHNAARFQESLGARWLAFGNQTSLWRQSWFCNACLGKVEAYTFAAMLSIFAFKNLEVKCKNYPVVKARKGFIVHLWAVNFQIKNVESKLPRSSSLQGLRFILWVENFWIQARKCIQERKSPELDCPALVPKFEVLQPLYFENWNQNCCRRQPRYVREHVFGTEKCRAYRCLCRPFWFSGSSVFKI